MPTVDIVVTRARRPRMVYAASVVDLRPMRGEIAILGGYRAANDGGGGMFLWSDTVAADDAGTALNVNAATVAGWRRIIDGDLNVLWFGAQPHADPDATRDANNRAAIQAAIDAAEDRGGATVYLPPGLYWTNAVITILAQNITIRGAGREASRIKNQTSNVFELGDGTGALNPNTLKIRDIHIEGRAGHVFAVIGNTRIGGMTIENTYLVQTDPAKRIWNQDGSDFTDNLICDSVLEHVAASTVPTWYIRGGATNENRFRDLKCVNAGRHFFRLENNSDAGWIANNHFENIDFALMYYGCIDAYGVANLIVENCNPQDSPTIAADCFAISPSTHASPVASRDNAFRNCHRYGGTLTEYDIKLAAGTVNTVIDNCHAHGGTALHFRFNNTSVVMTGVRGDGVVIVGDLSLTWISQGTMMFNNKVSILSSGGDPNGTFEHAKGSIMLDVSGGKLWKKTTAFGVTTGWIEMDELD